MELSKLIELLKQLGIEISDDATEEMIMEAMKNGYSKVKETEAAAAEVKAAHSRDSADLVTARASIASLTKQVETLTAAHAEELTKVKASVNAEVASIVRAAGLKAPLPADKIAAANAEPAKPNPTAGLTGLAKVVAAFKAQK